MLVRRSGFDVGLFRPFGPLRSIQFILVDLKKKKNLSRVDCQCSEKEKKIQNTQEIKRTLFNWKKKKKIFTFNLFVYFVQLVCPNGISPMGVLVFP